MASIPPTRRKIQNATRFDRLTHDDAIARKLQVMDTAAFALARDNGIPIVVFSVDEPSAISSAILGQGARHLRHAVSGAISQAPGFGPKASAAGPFTPVDATIVAGAAGPPL